MIPLAPTDVQTWIPNIKNLRVAVRITTSQPVGFPRPNNRDKRLLFYMPCGSIVLTPPCGGAREPLPFEYLFL